MPMDRRAVFAFLACGLASTALGDPPPGYYDSVTGTDAVTIQSQLNALLNTALTRSYGEASLLLQDIEEDPNNLANIILVYNGASIPSGWDSGASWNREHTWPRSLGVGDSGSDYSDLHQLHACNPSINSSRGNKQFGTFPGQFDPNQYGFNYRGRMARMAFYMKTRYPYLIMSQLGVQQQFVDWHIAEMPGDVDNYRNDRVYNAQQNRNAFADRPEWVWVLFGDAPSDAQIKLAGQTATDGASAQTIDLGLRIGEPSEFPALSLDLEKSGAAPTTYSIVTTGEVAQVSRYQFGAARNAQSLSHSVSFTGSAFGPFGGTVTVDNTDLTTSGAGFGSGDGDDVVTITGIAIDHALASFSESSAVSALTVDFGTIDLGEPALPASFSVWNIAPDLFSANLDIDSVMITGDTGAFASDLAAQAGIVPGNSADFMVQFDTLALGAFEAVAVIEVSDEDLPGAGGPVMLTVTFRGSVVSPCTADTNGDGMLSPADFTAWIAAFNSASPACDQNDDSLCTPADFTAWIANYNLGC